MPQKQTFGRSAWVDRFNKPTAEQLRSGLRTETAVGLFDALRTKFKQFPGVAEDTRWFGDCWFWSVAYQSSLTEEPLAVIVPAPDDLQVAMPLERDLANKLASTRMKRLVRDGFELAAEPFHTQWGVWSITYPSLVDDVLQIVKQRIKFLSAATSAGAAAGKKAD
jgi:hypothetical protein